MEFFGLKLGLDLEIRAAHPPKIPRSNPLPPLEGDLQLKMVKYPGNIKAVFLTLGTTNVHHKRDKMTPLALLR